MSRPIPELMFQGTQHTLKTHICCQGGVTPPAFSPASFLSFRYVS